MDGFTKLPKMQHFKEGGGVKNAYCGGGKAYKKGGEVSHEDIVEDKKIVKKAFNIHDKQQHEEKTDLSKLKKGGRAKKDCGTVRKYKAGGPIKMKKDAEDIREISEVKKVKAEKLCSGGKPKKMADGSLTEKIMGTEAQNEASKKTLEQVAKQPGLVGTLERGAQKATNFLKGQGAVTDAEKAMADKAAATPSAAGKKRGGKC